MSAAPQDPDDAPLAPARRNLALVCVAAGAGMPLLASRFGPAGPDDPNAPLIGLLTLHVVMVCLAFGVAAFLRPPVRESLGLVRGPVAGGLGWPRLIGCGLALLLFSRGLNELLLAFEVRDAGSMAEIDGMLRRARQHSVALAILAVGVGPGIAEELLFRGLLQRQLVPRWGPALGILGAAAIFGLVHSDPLHTPVALVLGVVLGIVGWRAGNVWAPMLCHTVNNAAAASHVLAGIPLAALGGGFAAPVAWLLAGAVVLAWFARPPPGPRRSPDDGSASA